MQYAGEIASKTGAVFLIGRRHPDSYREAIGNGVKGVEEVDRAAIFRESIFLIEFDFKATSFSL